MKDLGRIGIWNKAMCKYSSLYVFCQNVIML
jgi:hypothetical protein